MKTKLKKTIINHPKTKFTSKGITLRWAELEPEYRRQIGILLAQGQCREEMERGKKIICFDR